MLRTTNKHVITVIRDTSTGECHLTDFDLDEERLDECGYEIAGQLANPHRVTLHNDENVDLALDEDAPEFTTCERVGCTRWIMIDEEGGAPEYCSTHAIKYNDREV